MNSPSPSPLLPPLLLLLLSFLLFLGEKKLFIIAVITVEEEEGVLAVSADDNEARGVGVAVLGPDREYEACGIVNVVSVVASIISGNVGSRALFGQPCKLRSRSSVPPSKPTSVHNPEPKSSWNRNASPWVAPSSGGELWCEAWVPGWAF